MGANGFIFTAIIASLAILVGGSTANASITIWANDGSGWDTVATGGTSAFTGSYTSKNGLFKLTTSNAGMQDGPLADVNSSTFHLQHIGTTSDNLSLVVLATGFTSPTTAPIYVDSQVSGINNSGALTALTFQSFVDSTNNADPSKLAGGLGLQSPTIYPTITGPGADLNTVILSNLSSPFSVAHQFSMTMSGDGLIVSLGGDTALSPFSFLTPVPEPSSVALVCLCVTSLGGFGWRRRRQQLEEATATAETPPAA